MKMAERLHVRALDHVGINVTDLDAAVDWYRRAFGFETARPFTIGRLKMRGTFLITPDGTGLEIIERQGAQSVGVLAEDPPAQALRVGLGHLCFRVDDVDAAHARLLELGAVDRFSPRPAPEPGVRMSYVADPFGNFIELLDRHTGPGA
jgi:lactoylglutathione lyase